MKILWLVIVASFAAKSAEGNSYTFLAINCQDSEVFQTKQCVHNETVLRVLTSINGSLNKINVESFREMVSITFNRLNLCFRF